jgi:CRISPR-associated protein Cmr2
MAALTEKGGKIVFPDVENDELYKAIVRKDGTGPYVGSLPNRFKADVTGMTDAGALCRDRIVKKWNELEAAVWTQFIKDVAEAETKEIWDRQVGKFWDISWVEGDDPGKNGDATWLDRRKNWREMIDLQRVAELETILRCTDCGNRLHNSLRVIKLPPHA